MFNSFLFLYISICLNKNARKCHNFCCCSSSIFPHFPIRLKNRERDRKKTLTHTHTYVLTYTPGGIFLRRHFDIFLTQQKQTKEICISRTCIILIVSLMSACVYACFALALASCLIHCVTFSVYSPHSNRHRMDENYLGYSVEKAFFIHISKQNYSTDHARCCE